MQKTLGGDRLGSGKKMKVDIHGFERSTFDLSYVWRSTMGAGTLVPFMSELALPGDTFDIDLEADIKTHPTVGPLFGSYKVQLDVFQCPIRLYNSLLHNNALKIGLDMSVVKIPTLYVTVNQFNGSGDIDNSQVNPSSIFAYLGLRGFGLNFESEAKVREFNALPYLSYWDIYKNYYSFKQGEEGAYIHGEIYEFENQVGTVYVNGVEIPSNPTTVLNVLNINSVLMVNWISAPMDWRYVNLHTQERGIISMYELVGGNVIDDMSIGANLSTGEFQYSYFGRLTINGWSYADNFPIMSTPQVKSFPLDNIDKMREDILAFTSRTTPFTITPATQAPYGPPLLTGTQTRTSLITQEGLGVKTYQSDLFNNWLSTEWIDGPDGINEITAISTVGDKFTVDTFLLSKKVYNMMNKIAVSGGTYNDWLDVVYGEERAWRAETPIYMGGLSKELVFQEVVSNSQSSDQPLGTLAGRGVMSSKHKGGKVIINVDEPSYIIGIISLTPRIDYSQGNKWDMHLKTMDDLHKPDLDQIGFQDLITEQMAWWATVNNAGNWIQTSAGKQPAWINYMTNVNTVRGNFAIENNEMFMTLNRRYERDVTNAIKDLTVYIDPAKYNFVFAQTALDAQNFWAQIGVNITARRKMSAKVMPAL
jgi:hypothetical protein